MDLSIQISAKSTTGRPVGQEGESECTSTSSLGSRPSHQHGIATTKQKNENGKRSTSLPAPKRNKVSQKELDRLKKERKHGESKMTHKEYIETLPEKFHDRERTHNQYFSGLVILFAEPMNDKWPPVRPKLDLVCLSGCNESSFQARSSCSFVALPTRSHFALLL